MVTNFEQIVDTAQIGAHSNVNLNPIIEMAEQERFKPAANDSPRRLLLAIDVQKDFIEGGALAVPGSIADVERIAKFIYNNMEELTRIMCSLDTHTPYQIFHPCWWANSNGDHPAPYTVITYEDVVKDFWRPIVGDPRDSLDYLKGLESAGKKLLCIWPYHCIDGTEGHGLENEFAKMVYFHTVCRKSADCMISKGQDPFSEMYGIIRPEYSKNNFVNTPVLTAVEKYDEIYVVGEAASHCLMESVQQIAEYFEDRPEITQKITILEDCTSPIPGYESATQDAFDRFKSTYGIKFEKSTNIQLG